MRTRTHRMTGNQIALDILLSDASEEVRQRKLSEMSQAFSKMLNNEVACPDCGDEGPHEDNGGQVGRDLALCCRDCGNHFEV